MFKRVCRLPLTSVSATGPVTHIYRQNPSFLPFHFQPIRDLKGAPLQSYLLPRYNHQQATTKAGESIPAANTFEKMKDFPTPPSIESLQEQLSSLGVFSGSFPAFPYSNPTTNPVDIFRCYISDTLAGISGVDSKLIYDALEWTQSFEKGDLILAIPRLRLKGQKPDAIAKEWAEKVGTLPSLEEKTILPVAGASERFLSSAQ
jgi:hypothetical protein